MTGLPTLELGRTGLQVTILGCGTNVFRGVPRGGRDISPQQVGAALNAALDGGINFIDTSIDYGLSENRIGDHISHRRSEYYLATKCGCIVGDLWNWGRQHIYTRENIVAGVEQSLVRLKTDYIDVLQFHGNPSRETLEREEAVETLLDLKREGKARFIGMSSSLPNLADHIAMGVFDVFQIPYSLTERKHEDIISQAAQAGAGVIIRADYAESIPGNVHVERSPEVLWQQARLDELLDGMTHMQFGLRFTLTHPYLSTNIVGTINPDHVRDNINTVQKGPLPQDIYEEAKRRLTEAGEAPART